MDTAGKAVLITGDFKNQTLFIDGVATLAWDASKPGVATNIRSGAEIPFSVWRDLRKLPGAKGDVKAAPPEPPPVTAKPLRQPDPPGTWRSSGGVKLSPGRYGF